MQKIGFSGMKSLDSFRSLGGSVAGAGKPAQIASSRPSFDSSSYGSFANLKITAEKLVKEQASVKTDLDLAHTKLKRATEQIHVLEGKLQQAVNENAKLKVKQTEDSKLWQGLDSKVSSTKTLCDQLTETLQQLVDQICMAEGDKKLFEERFDLNSKSFDDFNSLLSDLSSKLECADNKINAGKQEISQLKQDKDEMEKCYKDQLSAIYIVIKEKDSVIKQLDGTVEETKAHLQTLGSQLQKMEQELRAKEDCNICLRDTIKSLESENYDLKLSNEMFSKKLDKSYEEHTELERLVCGLMAKVVELDKVNVSISSRVSELLSSYGAYCELIQEEKSLTAKSAERKIEHLNSKYKQSVTENDAFKIKIEELKSKIAELQRAQEFLMVQHAEECHLSEDKIRKLESETKDIVSKKEESEKLATELQERLKQLLDASSLTKNQMQDLLQKLSRLESENQDLVVKLQSAMQEKVKETEDLQSEINKRVQQLDELQNHVSQFRNVLDEKEQLHMSLVEREKNLEEQKLQVQATLAATESQLCEAKRQYDVMLEGKQLELAKHLKELSQKNDQAINEIRKKFELEKEEVANAEKEKADKLIKEIERKCNGKISECEEDAQKCLMRVKEEHGATITRIQQDFEEKESRLVVYHKEELQRLQLHSENEMRERLSSLRKEHEIQMRSLKIQLEDDYRKLQEELELQKSKEEKQRALLQLQWKVMGEDQQVDQEMNAKKEYSVSSIKMRDPYSRKEHQLALRSPESKRKDVGLSGILQTPIANILKKVDKGSAGGIPNHRKVTRHEYEVETANGRTITKRRKTRSTVMFGEPNSQKSMHGRAPVASKDVTRISKGVGGPHPDPANIRDLFSEGSLNPYNDDPYAFD